ncbi:MAG TPA: type II toxin-antitoxin system VapC family toxin [Stellaceae bacterium]|nr:type II toxin-antitoxin system VapC family toxin [Stellaceae bacterium]
MIRFLLDANAVIGLLNDSSSNLARRVRRESVDDVAVSAIVVHELCYGAFKSRRADRNVGLVDALRFRIVEFDREDARQAGEIRAFLASRGMPIGGDDVLIAGQAMARGLVLVTHNVGEFDRVPGLRLEDWEI